MQVPKVSIIIPSYNHEKYIEECLMSVIDCDYPNVQVVVIDDGSTDESQAILKRLKYSYSFELILQENLGLTRTLNKAITQLVKGEYIKIISSDDKLTRDGISESVKLMQNHKNYDVLIGGVQIINGDGIPRGKILGEDNFQTDYLSFLKGKYRFNQMGWFFRMDFFGKHGLFEEDVISEDVHMNRKIFKYGKVLLTKKHVAYYRKHGSNTSANSLRMEQGALENLQCYSDDEYYEVKKRREYLNLFVLFAAEDKRKSLFYGIRAIRFVGDILFWKGIYRLLFL